MGKYTQAINLQRQAIRLRKEAAGLDTKAGIADWLANNWGRLAAGGAAGLGTYALSSLFDPKNKNRGIRAALSAIAAGLVGTKGYDWAKGRYDANKSAEKAVVDEHREAIENADAQEPAPSNQEPELDTAPVNDPTGFDAAVAKNAKLVALRQRLADARAAAQKRKTGIDPLTSGNKFGDMTPAQIAERNAAPGEIKIGPTITKADVRDAATAPVDIAKNLWNASAGNLKAAQQAKKNAAAQKERNEIKDLEAQIKALEGK